VLGRFLFRWRGVIGFVAFGVVFWLARPTFGSCLLGLPIVLVGLVTRFWASGYIGIEGRAREIGASRRLVSGPYRLLRHPLYIGNFMLVAGMLVALRPALWLGAVVLAGFIAEYSLIVAAEEAELAEVEDKSKAKSQEPKAKAEEGEQANERSQRLEARSQSAEVHGTEGGVTDEPEAKGQKSKGKAANGEGRMAKGEQFSSVRALCEWRTWVVTGAVWGLAMLKAAIVS
jgi:hypothetical protein